MDRIQFIINPVSGGRKNRNIESQILSGLDQTKFSPEISYTKAIGHATELCIDALSKEINFIVAVGGDGTINEIAKVMVGTKAVLGIMPVGSGNGLARHLGIPLHVKGALQIINKSKVKRIDTGMVDDTPFISIAGVGYDALVAKEFKKSSARGFLNYFRISAKWFLNYKSEKYTLHFNDGTSISEKALMICFANSNQFGYNTMVAPHAKLDDGKLDICIVKKPKIFQLPQIANLLLQKKIDRSKLVHIILSDELTLSREKNAEVNIDGEAMKLKKDFVVKVNPLSLSVFIP